MIVIQASNIHGGGGAVLLTELLRHLDQAQLKCLLYVDSRYVCPFKLGAFIEVHLVKPTILNRVQTEWLLFKLHRSEPHNRFLFFGNLPPLFPFRNNVILFFQNVVLLKSTRRFEFGWRTKVKHFIERAWLNLRIKSVEKVIVQTESVKQNFSVQFPQVKIDVVAFMTKGFKVMNSVSRQKKKFVYVASADPHKNHLNLLKAWKLLCGRGHFFQLTLTAEFSAYSELKLLEELAALGADVVQWPALSHVQVAELYQNSDALIFPSFVESLGLPLLEAKAFGLPILAAELDYVRDVVEPEQSFDPHSPLSISRAVLRFSEVSDLQPQKLKPVSDFFDSVLN